MIKLKKLLFKNISIKQTLAKNIFWLSLAEGISKFLMFFLTILIARYLGAEGYGIFSFAFAFVALFAVIADFGLSTLTIREVARNKKLARKYIDNIAVMKLILGIITFALIIAIVQFLGKSPEIETLVYLAGIFIIIQSFTGFFQSIFRAFEKMEYEALSKIIYSITLFGIAFFIIWQKLGLKLLIQSYVYAALIAFIITLILIRKKFTKFWAKIDFDFWKTLLKEAWPFALSFIFISIYYYLDTVMLSLMKTDAVVGWYGAAYRPILFLTGFVGILFGSVFPIISRFYKKSKKKLQKLLNNSIKMMIALALPLAFGGTILASHIILLLYGQEYLKSILAFQILIWAVAIIYITVFYGNSLQACNRQKVYLYGVGFGALLNIILNFALIPSFSLYGAATATLLTELFVFVFMFIQINKVVKIKFAKYFYKPFIASVVMFFILFLIKDLNLFLLLVTGIVIYFAVMLVIKGFSYKEILILLRRLKGKKRNKKEMSNKKKI